RLDADGSPDGSFGNGGVSVVAALGSRTDLGAADHTVGLALQGDRVLVGNRVNGNFGLARLDASGNLDQTFGVGGVVSADFADDDGTKVTISLTGGGTGKAFYDGTNVDLLLTGTGDASNLSVRTIGGDGKVAVRNIQSDGGLHAVNARAATLAGTLWTAGNIG